MSQQYDQEIIITPRRSSRTAIRSCTFSQAGCALGCLSVLIITGVVYLIFK